MPFDPNKLFGEMCKIFAENYSKDNRVTICNEGSSRSSKTWDFFHFLEKYCADNKGSNQEIYILRETLTNCKDFTLKEFKKCMYAIGANHTIFSENQKPYCNMYGNHVFFRGLDDSAEGYPSDIIFINEALENQNKAKIDGLIMRCRKLVVMDWNPKYTDHWCFDLEGQPNTFFTHSTYKQNKHLEKSVIRTIEGYCPWHFDDLHLPENKRRPNKENIESRTADKYRWLVYGEGIRAAQEGVIFPDVTWIDHFPKDCELIYYGIDFGYTNDPTAITKVGRNGNKLYIELLHYHPTENSNILIPVLDNIIGKDRVIWCDSADPGMISDLRKVGFKAFAVNKFPGSIKYGIDLMKRFEMYIVSNKFAKQEQAGYIYKTIQGIRTNEPEDKYNHMWDSARYACIANIR